MNRQILVRAILWQVVISIFAALAAYAMFGFAAGLSCALGALCVTIPNALFALYLIGRLQRKEQQGAVWVLLGEIFKLAGACILFAVVARGYPELNWPGMIVGISVACLSSFALLAHNN